jgi:hypothetical protein|tara:strand:+ start:2423 stop:2947 length:525 start_codon:yes stop_codon:yes gene_type:complete
MIELIGTVIVTQIAFVVWGFIIWDICKRRLAKAERERANIVSSSININKSHIITLDELEDRVLELIRSLSKVKHSLPHCDDCKDLIKYPYDCEVYVVEDTFHERERGIGKTRLFCSKECSEEYQRNWDSNEQMRDHFDSVKFANDVNYSMWSQFREALAYKPTNIKGGEPNGTF